MRYPPAVYVLNNKSTSTTHDYILDNMKYSLEPSTYVTIYVFNNLIFTEDSHTTIYKVANHRDQVVGNVTR